MSNNEQITSAFTATLHMSGNDLGLMACGLDDGVHVTVGAIDTKPIGPIACW